MPELGSPAQFSTPPSSRMTTKVEANQSTTSARMRRAQVAVSTRTPSQACFPCPSVASPSLGCEGFETGAERPPQPPVVEELAQQASRNRRKQPLVGRSSTCYTGETIAIRSRNWPCIRCAGSQRKPKGGCMFQNSDELLKYVKDE